MKAFGAISRESGHSRVPAPPDRITGTSGEEGGTTPKFMSLKGRESTPHRKGDAGTGASPGRRCIMDVLSALPHRRSPGVNWFRRGLQRSAGHAEALVLVKLEQSQT